MKRCSWVNLNNPLYVSYHDKEWGVFVNEDRYLFEMLVLEGFQAGLSWECILNKRESFKEALDNFDYEKIAKYDDDKVSQLLNNKMIIRNKLKIKAMIKNAQVFILIIKEYQTFANYIWHFTNGRVIKNKNKQIPSSSILSDTISKDLSKRGMQFVGSKIIYAYLEAIGVIDDHEINCYKY